MPDGRSLGNHRSPPRVEPLRRPVLGPYRKARRGSHERRDDVMRAAAPLAISGLLALILFEVLKFVLPVVMVWLVAAVVMALKIGLTIVALIGTILVVRYFMKRADRAGA